MSHLYYVWLIKKRIHLSNTIFNKLHQIELTANFQSLKSYLIIPFNRCDCEKSGDVFTFPIFCWSSKKTYFKLICFLNEIPFNAFEFLGSAIKIAFRPMQTIVIHGLSSVVYIIHIIFFMFFVTREFSIFNAEKLFVLSRSFSAVELHKVGAAFAALSW